MVSFSGIGVKIVLTYFMVKGSPVAKFDKVSVPEVKKPKRAVFRVFLHCSASDAKFHDKPEVIEAWHKLRKFSEIGYHFFISKDGTIWEGRDLERTPAAQAGHNANTIAICLHGLDKDKFTIEQFASLRALCIHLNVMYKRTITFHGHKEVAQKECPVFDYKKVLKLDEHGRMN